MPAKARTPWGSVALGAATLLAYAAVAAMADGDALRLIEAGAIRADQPRLATLMTSLALHASIAHLAVNLALLGLFGPGVEARSRAWGLALIYFLSGAAGGLAHLWLAPPEMRSLALVGASGAVSGLMGAHSVLRPERRVHLALAILWAAVNLAGMLVIDRAGQHRISYATHVGGLAAGALIGAVLAKLVRSR